MFINVISYPFSLFSHVLDSIKGYIRCYGMDGRFRKVVSFCKLATREETGNLEMVQLRRMKNFFATLAPLMCSNNKQTRENFLTSYTIEV